MIDRNKLVVLTNVTLPAGVTAVTLARPETTNPALSNNKDHVIEPQSRDEFRAGKAHINDLGPFDLATVSIRRIELVRQFEGYAPNSPNFGSSPQGTNVIGVDDVGPTPGAMFPNGSLGVGEPRVLFDDATGLALGGQKLDDPASDTPAEAIYDLLRNIPIRANQQIRITFNNAAAPIGPAPIAVSYNTGLYPSDYALQS